MSGKRYVGERVLQSCGEYAEIIELLPNRKCRVRFDSGIERECGRTEFLRKIVALKPTSKRYVGERVLQKCGEYAEIIELLPNKRCLIRFDSGFEKICSRKGFCKGEITRRSRKIINVGDKFLQICGEYAEVVELLPNSKCRVIFDSGLERECKRGQVCSGILSNKGVSYRHVGERVLQKCGEWAEIIKLLDGGACRVKFDNGVEVICSRSGFKAGTVSYKKFSKRIIGEKVAQNCGAIAELVAFEKNNECTVKFKDGYTCVVERGRFTKGTVTHPLLRYC